MALQDLPDYCSPIFISGLTIPSIPIDITAMSIGTIHIDIASESIGNLNVNIAASAITLNVNIASQSPFNLNVNIAACAVSVNVHETGTANVAITSSITLNMQLTGSTITLNTHESGTANVSITSSVTINMNITGSSVTVPTHEGGTANVSVVSSVTLNITITGSTVDINIKTSGGANIIIDKLTQSAYTERRGWIQNEGATATDLTSNYTNRRGKFFPRGCRGEIAYIMVYARNPDSSAHSFTVYIAPEAGMGPVYSNSFSVPAGSAFDWRFVPFYKFWNYDSLFIWVRCENDTYPILAYDTGSPNDGLTSTDDITWYEYAGRYWLRASIMGQTVGDIPISGTVNTVEIPNSIGARQGVSLAVPLGSEVCDTAQLGSGELLIAIFMATDGGAMTYLVPRIKVDDVSILPWNATFEVLNGRITSVGVPGISIGKWDATNNYYSIIVVVPFPFKRKLEVGFFNTDTLGTHNGTVGYTYKKIS